jgi:hypothetical protein
MSTCTLISQAGHWASYSQARICACRLISHAGTEARHTECRRQERPPATCGQPERGRQVLGRGAAAHRRRCSRAHLRRRSTPLSTGTHAVLARVGGTAAHAERTQQLKGHARRRPPGGQTSAHAAALAACTLTSRRALLVGLVRPIPRCNQALMGPAGVAGPGAAPGRTQPALRHEPVDGDVGLLHGAHRQRLAPARPRDRVPWPHITCCAPARA